MTVPDPAARVHFFRELDGDRTGLAQIGDGFVKLSFFGFDTLVEHSDDQPVHVVMDDGSVLSLHQNQRVPVSVVLGDQGEPRVSRAEVVSRLALIGSDPWRADQPVRCVSFCCPDADHLFKHVEKQRRIIQAGSLSDDDLRLLYVSAGEAIYGADHVIKSRLGDPVPQIDGIRFWIGFPGGCPLDDVRQRLTRYLSFLTFIANRRIAPQSVCMVKAMAQGAFQPEHKVVWSWPAPGPQSEPCPVWRAPFVAQEDDDLAAMAQGLSCWIERADTWQAACVRMTACLGSTEEIVSERLLAAWRWFERLPDTKERKVLDREAITPLVDAAFAAAQENGLDISRERIDGKLQELRNESFRQVVHRLVRSAAASAGLGDIASDLQTDIIAGRRLRGDAAHGRLAKPGQQNAVQLVRSASATKAFCFLFTARDLPLAPTRRERLRHHPLVADYSRLLAANRQPSP
ncbi:hypothetical protein [Paracoccus sp. SSK6]|uniref:hypothetical protein n=1 Tax=Paracoccus sp. SSK6 TaxID=3143131 RepID=UPI00321B0EFC